MRITNDCPPHELLCELLAAGLKSEADTATFAEEDWSNHNFICNALRERIDAMLHCYERLGNEAHVTQGVRDNGVDLVLEVRGRRIGIQVKSNREAIDATNDRRARGASMESILKMQASDATKWRLDEWWVVLCFDVTQKQHAELVRRINSELKQLHLSMQVRIFEPTQAWRMLGLDASEVEALCVRRLCQEDEILVAAQRELGTLGTVARFLVLSTIFEAIADEEARAVSSEELSRMADEINCDIEALSDVLDGLNNYLEPASHRDSYSVHFNQFPGCCALYYSGLVRHEMNAAEAAAFVRQILLD